MRWSLRSLVALVTVIAMVLAYRQNTIRRTERATQQILDAGGEVLYRWQNARIAIQTSALTQSYTTYTFNPQTGERVPGPPPQFTVTQQAVEFLPPLDVKQGIIEFCFGRLATSDVKIVILPAKAVNGNESVVKALAAFPSLESVLVQEDHPDAVQDVDPSAVSRAMEQLQSKLPDVSIVSAVKSYRRKR